MCPPIFRRTLALLLLPLGGCEGLLPSHGLPDDPLFIHRKPLEARAVSGPPVTLAHVEPAPPPNPYFLARSPARSVPGVLTNRLAGDPSRAPE